MNKRDFRIIVVSLVVILCGIIFSCLIKNQLKIYLFSYNTSLSSNTIVKTTKNLKNIYKNPNAIIKNEVLNKKLLNKEINKSINNGSDFIFILDNNINNVYNMIKTNKDVKFCVLNAKNNKNLSNLCTIQFDLKTPSFISGYIAGKTTETNKIGFIGGKKDDFTSEIEGDFILGVKAANEKCDIISDYSNTYVDKQMGYALATAQYDEGIDVIMEVAGVTGDGIVQRAEDAGKWVMGINLDKKQIRLPNVLSSININYAKAIKTIIDKNNKSSNFKNRDYIFAYDKKIINVKITNNVDIQTKNELEKYNK